MGRAAFFTLGARVSPPPRRAWDSRACRKRLLPYLSGRLQRRSGDDRRRLFRIRNRWFAPSARNMGGHSASNSPRILVDVRRCNHPSLLVNMYGYGTIGTIIQGHWLIDRN